jgi:cell division protein ZapA (FtsZ GTPase activity inhibitor)
MTKKNIPNPDVSVFIKFLDRGFKLSVPADQEKYYRNGYESFMQRVNEHKSKEKGGYDDIEAMGLTAIECMVALQRIREQMDGLLETFQERVGKLDADVSKALES